MSDSGNEIIKKADKDYSLFLADIGTTEFLPSDFA